jgi:hypothetical protein
MSDDATSVRDTRWRDAALGALFIAAGILAFVGARELVGRSGSVAGPGAMPMVLSIALVVLGAIVAIGGVIRPRPTVPASLGPLVWVLAAATAFGLALPALGLVCAAVLAAAIAMRGGRFGSREGPPQSSVQQRKYRSSEQDHGEQDIDDARPRGIAKEAGE